jgi:molybdopterin synthase catalytic subunit
MFEVWDKPLALPAVLEAVSHAGAGAVDVFVGVVRDHNEGRTVTLLEYEAYGTMAVKEMERIGAEIAAAMPGVKLAALHRVGALHVGEWAVVCVASAPHRREAFVACRKLIDEIKAHVPVWKREHGPDGPYWVGWEDARCDEAGHRHDHDHAAGHHHGKDEPVR